MQIKIYHLDNLKKDSLSVFREIFEFLGVDKSVYPYVKIKHNVGSVFPKSYIISNLLGRLRYFSHHQLIKELLPTKLISSG